VATNANVGVAKANLFPTITLTAAGGHVSTALSDLFSAPTKAWSVAGGLLQPLLSPQRNLYQLDLAMHRSARRCCNTSRASRRPSGKCPMRLIGWQKYAEFQVAQQAQVDAQRKANTIALARYRVAIPLTSM